MSHSDWLLFRRSERAGCWQSILPLIGTGLTVIDKANVDHPNIKRFIYSA